MSEEADTVAEAEDVAVTPAADGADNQEPSLEDKALRMGWTPKGQFKGDPEKWVDAEAFIKRGEEFLPFLKANNKALETALEKSNREMAAMKRTMDQFKEFHSKTEARAYERAMKDLQSQQEQAVAAGDVDGVREITKEIVALNKDVAPKPKDDGPTVDLDAWKAENTWFETDRAMRGAAIEIAEELTEKGVLGEDQLKEVSKRIKAEFPHKFDNPRRREPGAVESGGSARRPAGKTYADLPADAKAMCDDFVKQKLLTREQYVKEYQW